MRPQPGIARLRRFATIILGSDQEATLNVVAPSPLLDLRLPLAAQLLPPRKRYARLDGGPTSRSLLPSGHKMYVLDWQQWVS